LQPQIRQMGAVHLLCVPQLDPANRRRLNLKLDIGRGGQGDAPACASLRILPRVMDNQNTGAGKPLPQLVASVNKGVHVTRLVLIAGPEAPCQPVEDNEPGVQASVNNGSEQTSTLDRL
jgi:hypothetical protein